MIKINTPDDIIIQEIEKDNFLVDLVNVINEKINGLEILPVNGFNFSIILKESLTNRQKNLLMYLFGKYGWSLSINFIGKNKEENYQYTIFIIEEKKIYLN